MIEKCDICNELYFVSDIYFLDDRQTVCEGCIKNFMNSIKSKWINLEFNGASKLATYDIDNSWLHGLNVLGYPKIAQDIHNTTKMERLAKIYKYEKKIPNLLEKCENIWLKWIKKFIALNNISISDIQSINYDAITIKASVKITHEYINKNVKFDKESTPNRYI